MDRDDGDMHKAFGICFGGIVLLAMGASFLQWAGPIFARTLTQLEQHSRSIVAIVVVVLLLYGYVRIKVARIRGRGRAYSTATVQQPAYAFHPGRDRPGLLGTLGRMLAERRGGPVIYDGGRPLGLLRLQDDDVDDEEDDDEPSEEEHRYTAAEAKRIYQTAVADRRRRH